MLTRLVGRLVAGLLVAVPLVAVGGTADAAACSGTTGVTVIVQFPSGSTTTGCAPGNPTSGIAALTGAGFSYAYHPRNPGFVCKINGLPGDGNCMKPNYWAYFHAQRGGSWSYSSLGAASYDPAPGSVEGWRFGTGTAPSTPPPARVASTPKPTTKATPKPAPTKAAQPTAAAGAKAVASAKASVSASAKAEKQARTAKKKAQREKAQRKKAAAAVSPSASATPTDDPSPVSADTAATAVPDDEKSGSLPWWWGVVALVVVGGGAGAVTLLRRSGG